MTKQPKAGRKTIGITGQSGFIGSHLFNYLNLKADIQLIPFEDVFFKDEEKLNNFVSKCDVIIHLAAMNRHGEPQVIYDTNIKLVEKLIHSLEKTGSTPHVLFSSSTQEEKDNLYGASKKKGRELFTLWATKNNTKFSGLIIPNVFGPFGKPFYNSVIATFCHQLTHNETPQIHVDGELKLIYVNELIEYFYQLIKNQNSNIETKKVPHSKEIKVSEILKILENFRDTYQKQGVIPNLNNCFEKNLFNTFICYLDIRNHFPVKLKLNKDERGLFVETIKLNSGGQVSFSTTNPGITRGNHYHTRKAERFTVIKGNARIQLRKIGTDEILNFDLSGEEPAYVDMPIWYTHNITNTGNEELYTLFWINEHFNPKDPDTYYENVEK